MLSLQRSKFSLPAGSTYLNCAYMSPLLRRVEKEGVQGIKNKRNPAKVTQQDFFTTGEIIRKEYAKLIGCKEPNRIAIIPSASYGLANVVHNIKLKSTDEIIVLSGQFPSNYYPWQRLCNDSGATLTVIAPPDTLDNRGRQWNERLVESINKNTRIVAMGHVHWADGTLFDLKSIRKRSNEVGAFLIIDGTQSVGALPFSIQSIQPDALVCSGYKWLMGPYSIGLAYYGPAFDGGKPIEENWINRLHSADFAGLVNYENKYHPGALRYEVGEHSNFILAPMLLEALRQINNWKPTEIQDYCNRISEKAISLLRENNFWVEDEKYRAKHLFGIRIPDNNSIAAIKSRLTKKNIYVSYRGDAIRVSPHVYNQEKDLVALAQVLIA